MNPVILLAEHLHLKVVHHPNEPFPLRSFAIISIQNSLFLLALGIWFYFSVRINEPLYRRISAGFGLAVLLIGPVFFTGSGILVVSYGMPAMSFLGALHVIDIFFVRSIENVRTWNFARLMCQLFAYPNEKSTSVNPRWDNLSEMRLNGLKYLAVNLLLYVIPPPHIWSEIKPLSLAYFLYATSSAFAVLFLLGCFVESNIRGMGILFGIEMNPLFNNPCGASNIRGFWARWNLVIKDGLSRVFFQVEKSSKPTESKDDAADPIEHAILESTDSDRKIRNSTNHNGIIKSSLVDGSKLSNNGPTKKRVAFADHHEARYRNSSVTVESAQKAKPFLPKALAALGTFIASGLFHEYMNLIAFPSTLSSRSLLPGSTLAFFIVHAFATIFYTYLKRYHSHFLRLIPDWSGILIVNFFAFFTTPLFCESFLRVGLFEDMKAFGIFGPVDDFIYLFGDGY